MSNLYLADGFYSFFLQFCLSYCSQGAHSRIFLFYPSFLFCLLGVEVYFWFWLTRVCFSVGFSRLSGIYFLVGFSRLSACLEHTIYRWCPSGFTLHSFSSKRSEFLEYTSFLCFCLSSYFLVENKIKATFSLICFVSRGVHSRISCLLGTEVYFWFWLNQSLFSVGFSRLSGICHFTGGAFSRFTLHSFSSKRSEFSEYTSFLCSFILFPS